MTTTTSRGEPAASLDSFTAPATAPVPAAAAMGTAATVPSSASPKGAATEQLFEEACRYIPGGTSRIHYYFPPYPIYARSARGCTVRRHGCCQASSRPRGREVATVNSQFELTVGLPSHKKPTVGNAPTVDASCRYFQGVEREMMTLLVRRPKNCSGV